VTFSVGDFGYAVRAADGSRVLIPCSPSVEVDDFALPARLAGGGRTLVKASLGPHSVDDIVVPAGLVGGGKTLVRCNRPKTPIGCNSCSPALWSKYGVRISGFTGSVAFLNGTYEVTYIGACTWRNYSEPPFPEPAVRLNYAGYWHVLLSFNPAKSNGGVGKCESYGFWVWGDFPACPEGGLKNMQLPCKAWACNAGSYYCQGLSCLGYTPTGKETATVIDV